MDALYDPLTACEYGDCRQEFYDKCECGLSVCANHLPHSKHTTTAPSQVELILPESSISQGNEPYYTYNIQVSIETGVRKGRISYLWSHFKEIKGYKVTGEDGSITKHEKVGICNYCGARVGCPKEGTTNLKSHLMSQKDEKHAFAKR
jgi:hypothetical protein